MIAIKRIQISHCTDGVYLRWWFNGWHYWNFTNGYEITQRSESMGTIITRVFSAISKIETPTKIKSKYSYKIVLDGISSGNLDGFVGLLMAEKVEQYEGAVWREVKITRASHTLKESKGPAYILNFEVTRKELYNDASVFQKTQHFYIGDVECDIDEDEIIPVNRQENDIAGMQDRQSDFTQEFKIRKTRLMRSLFELSGEAGATTDFPYAKQSCRLVIDGIEIIGIGYTILNKTDDQYYYVSAYSGNLNFFNTLEDKMLSDLLLPSCNHTWNAQTQIASHSGLLDYIYPLYEPSDDATIIPLTDTGGAVEMYGGWVWPFVKVKAIFDEILATSGYTAEGDVLTNPIYLKMFMPIANLEVKALANLYFSATGAAWRQFSFYLSPSEELMTWENPILATPHFIVHGIYEVKITGTYTFEIKIVEKLGEPFKATGINIKHLVGVNWATIATTNEYVIGQNETGEQVETKIFTVEYDATYGEYLKFYAVFTYDHLGIKWNGIWKSFRVVSIDDAKLTYGATIDSAVGSSIANNLPEISQIDFIKMICNFFGLIPTTDARRRKIKFWNYYELYRNIPYALDWSDYLSETETEVEFQFGDYCQNNYMKFADSDDVIKDRGMGNMIVSDTTLPDKQDSIEIPVATTDEVIVLTDVTVSRIANNTYNASDAAYDQEDEIDPRIIIVEQIAEDLTSSPVYQKTLSLRTLVGGGTVYSVTSPYKAKSLGFQDLILNYSSLSRMLTKSNVLKAKFNLPVYEVAGLKHYIPIYLNQYKAYFYVNKIENYVAGTLCKVELIRL